MKGSNYDVPEPFKIGKHHQALFMSAKRYVKVNVKKKILSKFLEPLGECRLIEFSNFSGSVNP